MNAKQLVVLWPIIKIVYVHILRPIVIDYVNNTETDLDDYMLKLLDKLFEVNENAKD